MKIGIMTFPNTTSYGCTLQMYALYHMVERIGAEAEIINYQNSFMKTIRYTKSGRKRPDMTGMLRMWITNALHIRQIIGFRRFERKMILYPRRPFKDISKLSELAKRYDSVICGSDQVWNPHIMGADLSYFLNFCGPETKRIAYAPSFGISKFSDVFTSQITPELKRFTYLSVREIVGAEFVESVINRHVETVLDPTFLISSEEWTTLEKTHPLAKGKYVLHFSVGKSPTLLQFSREIARRRNATLIVAGGNFLVQLRNDDSHIKYALDLSPAEWLNLMHHADCVVTNSFHGAAFSIHYHRDFYLEMSSKTNSRLEQLVSVCGLQNRVVGEECASWDESICYSQVESILAPIREASLEYLKRSVWQ